MTAIEWTAFYTTKRQEYYNSDYAKDAALGMSEERFMGEAIVARIVELGMVMP